MFEYPIIIAISVLDTVAILCLAGLATLRRR